MNVKQYYMLTRRLATANNMLIKMSILFAIAKLLGRPCRKLLLTCGHLTHLAIFGCSCMSYRPVSHRLSRPAGWCHFQWPWPGASTAGGMGGCIPPSFWPGGSNASHPPLLLLRLDLMIFIYDKFAYCHVSSVRPSFTRESCVNN